MKRLYRYARGLDGSTHLWIGRQRSVGKGEGRSGLRSNLAYVFTALPERADPAPGPRPALELARYDQKIPTERAGLPAPATPPARPGEALAVLAAVLDRDGQLSSASQDRSPVTRRTGSTGSAAPPPSAPGTSRLCSTVPLPP